MQAQRESTGIALPIFKPGIRVGGCLRQCLSHFTPREKETWYPLYKWASGLVWIGLENLAPTGVRTPGHPACS